MSTITFDRVSTYQVRHLRTVPAETPAHVRLTRRGKIVIFAIAVVAIAVLAIMFLSLIHI